MSLISPTTAAILADIDADGPSIGSNFALLDEPEARCGRVEPLPRLDERQVVVRRRGPLSRSWGLVARRREANP